MKIQSNPIADDERGLTVAEAAEFLGLSVSYLNKLRTFGGGPVYAKIGSRVRYTRKGLRAFRDRRVVHSTSEYEREDADARAS